MLNSTERASTPQGQVFIYSSKLDAFTDSEAECRPAYCGDYLTVVHGDHFASQQELSATTYESGNASRTAIYTANEVWSKELPRTEPKHCYPREDSLFFQNYIIVGSFLLHDFDA